MCKPSVACGDCDRAERERHEESFESQGATEDLPPQSGIEPGLEFVFLMEMGGHGALCGALLREQFALELGLDGRLDLPQSAIQPFGLGEFGVRAGLNDPPLVHHDDPIRVDQG